MGGSEEESSKSFKVQDRRRFSAEGELKPEFSGAEEKPASESKASAAESHEPSETSGAQSHPAAGAASTGFVHESAPRGAEVTFGAFLMSLSTEALIHLGEVPDPVAREQHRDLVSAQQVIDILGMLREKTRGNLEREEQALLDAILFDLRMKYVEIARQGS